MILRVFLVLIICSFAIQGQQLQMIKNVPDFSQPPSSTLPSTIDSNYCSPYAFLNIVTYWEMVQAHPNAQGMMGALSPQEVAEYVGWFMDTNDQGSPARMNGNGLLSARGTYHVDQFQGILDYCSFHQYNSLGFPYPIPAAKSPRSWDIMPFMPDVFPEYEREINDGFPVKLDFLYWHIIPTGDTLFDPGPPVDTILIYKWGPMDPTSAWNPEAPWEEWNLEMGENGIGHSVTGVGYIIDTLQFAIVHDNWSNTPQNIAIPWQHPMLPIQLVSYMLFVHIPPVNITMNDFQQTVEHFQLLQNYPNPFNSSTVIPYQLNIRTSVKLTLWDIYGQHLQTLVNRTQSPGFYRVKVQETGLASGVYFYQLESKGSTKIQKMIILR